LFPLFFYIFPEILVSGLFEVLLYPELPLPDLTPKSQTDCFPTLNYLCTTFYPPLMMGIFR
jgi:hypothetical protein